MNEQLAGAGLDRAAAVEVGIQGLGEGGTGVGERPASRRCATPRWPTHRHQRPLGQQSRARTGRGAPRQPATAFIPEIASLAL